ncbi:MAG TPA: ABC transporter permease [Chloroflexota bacterium]|nr:ABC transporter permease [Chloroflexota bacterium]
MRTVLVKRLIWLVFVLLGISLVTFTITHVIPADPARLMVGPHAAPEEVAAIRRSMGLDDPLPAQYVRYIGGLLHGDLGFSFTSRRPVRDDFGDYFPATVELTGAALFLIVALGIPLGVLSAVYSGSLLDRALRLLCVGGVAMPLFWTGLLFQLVFFRLLGWLPADGRLDTSLAAPPRVTGLYTIDSLLHGDLPLFANAVQHLILPGVALSLPSMALITRLTRTSTLETLGMDYVRTARSKGLRRSRVVIVHAVRNSLLPITTVLGLQTGFLLSGAFLVEVIFNWPGIGLYTLNAVLASDYNAIMSITLLVAAIYVLVNLGVDLLYSVLDPRVAVA